jgi:MFS family permease
MATLVNRVAPGPKSSVWYVLAISLVAALGGLLFGYDTAVIAGAIGYLQIRFELTPFWEGFAAASALAGCALGAGFAGFLSDRFGRKKVLVLAAVAFFVSALGTALPRTLAEFLAFRFLGGIGIGAASITSPMYIAEITPFRIRGRMVSLNQFAIVSGMLIVYFVNSFITDYGLARDEQTVAAHTAQHGTALDKSFAKDYLDKRIPEIVDRQVELFLVAPRARLDRPAVSGFIDEQAMPGGISAIDVLIPRASHDLRGDLDPTLLSPSQARTLLCQELPAANRYRIDRFLASPPKVLDSQLLSNFLAEAGINMAPIDVDLAAQGLVGWNVERGWRWMFGSGVLPALVFLVLLILVPESPRWLIKRGRRDEALGILTRVDGPEYAEAELHSIDETISQESGRLGELWEPWMRRVLLLGIALAVLQQVTGVNVFLYFAPRIFENLGAGVGTAMRQTVIVGAVNMVFTLLAITVVDRVGRKPLMLLGATGMGIALVGLGLAAYFQLFQWWALVFILGYIACFAMSVGPVVWVILSEIFPNQIRGRAMGLATICLWLANYIVSLTFPVMAENPWLLARFHQGFPFWVYAAFCAVLVVIVWRWVPETKGKTLEEIERSWMKT